MQSDVLPFTLYDSMDYSSVNDFGPPSGFAHRDSPQVQGGRPAAPPMQGQPQMQGQMPQQGQMQGQMPQQQSQGQVPMHPPPKLKGSNDELIRQIVVKEEDIDLGEEPVISKGADIGNYKVVSDLTFIILAVLFVDVFVICLVRFIPEVFGQSLNRWYDLFGLSAVIADVVIIVIGIVIARYVYTLVVKPKYGKNKWSPLMFTGVTVAIQLIHDLAFYHGIILQVPRGQNMMIDVFKDYAVEAGGKILFGDSLMTIASCLIAMILKSQQKHVVAAFGLVVTYILPYVLFNKNKFSLPK
jgi:hypothetical protein